VSIHCVTFRGSRDPGTVYNKNKIMCTDLAENVDIMYTPLCCILPIRLFENPNFITQVSSNKL